MFKKFLIGTFAIAALAFAMTASAAYDFGTTTLKVGSKGPAVVAVQTVVGATADGSFGPMTKAKVIVWQKANGLTADGLFGNKSKEIAENENLGGSVSGNFPAGCTSAAGYSSLTGQACVAIPSTVSGCASGALFSATTGQSCTGAVVVSGSKTEGFMTLQSAPVALTTAVGQSDKQDAVAAFAVKANDSDINVQRVSVNLTSFVGSTPTSALPWKYFTNLSLYQDNTLLGTINTSNLTENTFGLDYTAVFSGFNAPVAMNSTSSFIVKADIVDTIPALPANLFYKVGLSNGDSNAVRGTDGIGLTQYVGATSTSYLSNVTFGGTSSGVIKVVTNGANPIAQNIVTSTTTTTTGLTALVFDLQNTSKYDETIKSVTANITDNALVSGYYLYDGGSIVASLGSPHETLTPTVLSFTNLPSNFIVSANSTKTLTIKFDGAISASGAVSVTIPISGVTAIDTNSNLVNSTGAATGNDQTLQSSGVVVNLISATATSVASTQGVSGYSTGTFVFTVKANGVNLAKLSTAGNLVPTVIDMVANSSTGVVTSYTVSPDTTVSDGSQVTVTLNAVKAKTSVAFVQFKITSLVFASDASGGHSTVNTGLDNFYTNSKYQNY